MRVVSARARARCVSNYFKGQHYPRQLCWITERIHARARERFLLRVCVCVYNRAGKANAFRRVMDKEASRKMSRIELPVSSVATRCISRC